MGRLTNRSPRTEQLNLRVDPELKHAIARISAKLGIEPTDYVRAALKETTQRDLGEQA